jgi:hypothetical protein
MDRILLNVTILDRPYAYKWDDKYIFAAYYYLFLGFATGS